MIDRWRTILAIDHDPKAVEVYRANVPADDVVCGSVSELIGTLPYADVVLGGPPCQPYSHAGKRAGSDDARDCVPDFIAAVQRVRPRMFLMEQVEGFVTMDNGAVMHRTIAALESLGYRVEMRLLDAVDFGVPQFRLRAWFWGIRADAKARHRWPTRTHMDPAKRGALFGEELPAWVTTGEALGLDASLSHTRGGFTGTTKANSPFYESTSPSRTQRGEPHQVSIRRARGASVDRRDHPATEPCPTIGDGSGGSGGVLRVVGGVHDYRWSDAMLEKHPPASPASPAPTVQAKWYKGGAEGLVAVDPKHPVQDESRPATTLNSGGSGHGPTGNTLLIRSQISVRRLTPAECARLQSLPDDFTWPDSIAKTHRYRIIGNGWASLMAKHMSRALTAADPESRTVIDLFCGGGCGAVGWHGRAWEYQG